MPSRSITAISLRPVRNTVKCLAAASGSSLAGTVVRNVFLGATRDYVVEAKDGTQLRVTSAPDANFAPGAQVWLMLPAAACRALAG